MALTNLQIKVYPETEQDFLTLMAESESATKGKFLELLIETFRNPKVKTVIQDTPETLEALNETTLKAERLQNQLDGYLKGSAQESQELATYRDFFNEMVTVFSPYLAICQRDNLAKSYTDMFKLMLNILQGIPVKGPRMFVLTLDDVLYIKSREGKE